LLPELIPICQQFHRAGVADVRVETRRALDKLRLQEIVKPGMTIGIPVGSRGIRHICIILQEAIQYVRALGAQPIAIAAMGSHGGGTSEGQLEILHSLGITEAQLGVAIHVGVEVDEIGRTTDGTPVFIDSTLCRCDGVLLINRIKPHTSFRGPIESGLLKMMVVGCGKRQGAQCFHSQGVAELGRRLLEFGRMALGRLPVLGGIAILENQADETAEVIGVPTAQLIETEERLLKRARKLMPRLPVDGIDLLIVDVMGKNFSGTGLDTNVIGRSGILGGADEEPKIKRIAVLDLSAQSHGNANGVGLVDLVTRRLVDRIDFASTYLNCLTVMALERAKIPITLDTDWAVIETGLRTAGSPSAPRIARIKNTLEIADLLVSPALVDNALSMSGVKVMGISQPWGFDASGNLF